MANPLRSAARAGTAFDTSQAPSRLTTPQVFLWRMLVFLALAGFLVAILHKQIFDSFKANPGLNSAIVAVFAIGVLYTFRQVIRLYPEIRWVNSFRIAEAASASSHQPVLLAPMANMLRNRRGSVWLNVGSMRTIMDSLGSRLDEARDISRYLVGLLVFLGLLGTFWGLTETMTSIGRTISTLDTKAGESVDAFNELKSGLEAPLRGMGVAFSSSLLGLAGSLILGFLDLQVNQAHNRFYNELEEWLSTATEITPGTHAGADGATGQLAYTLAQIHRNIVELNERMLGAPPAAGAPGAPGNPDAVRELAQGVEQLIRQMRAEQKVVREWVDEQATQQQEVAGVLRELAQNIRRGG